MTATGMSWHRIGVAYTVELIKAMRLRFTFVGPVLVTSAVLVSAAFHPMRRDGVSDYAFLAQVALPSASLLSGFLLVAYCAGLVSSELGPGTVRLALVRPLFRHEFLLAKGLLGVTYACALTALAATTAWLIVLVRGDLVGVEAGGEVLFSGRQMMWVYVGAAGLSLVPQCAMVAYGVMVSSLTRSSAVALAVAIGAWVLADLVKYPLHVEGFLFTTYLDAPWQVFAARCDGFVVPWTPMAYKCVLTSAAATVCFMGAAIAAFRRRNLQV